MCYSSLFLICLTPFFYSFLGIINDPAESLFTYKAGQDFELFYGPDFTPAFEATFSDSELESQASILCGEDRSCLYDIATTGRTDIGQSTLRATQDYEYQVTLSIPSKQLHIPLAAGILVGEQYLTILPSNLHNNMDIIYFQPSMTGWCARGGSGLAW